MTTLAELVAATPAADRGIATQIDHDTGVWRYVLELADPAAGASVEWYDVTDLGRDRSTCGYDLTRGADEYDGPYRASVVHMDLIADDDRYAPWNTDTSPTFGTHVPLGAGLLMRAGFIRVTGGDTVVEWNPRWTNKVERWGDGSHARGLLRWHRITLRDLITSLVAQPVPETVEENWSERLSVVLAGWPYGSEVYGATFIGGSDVLTLPARDVQTSALAELKATLDPAGLVYYTDRRGVLIVRPRFDDTFHADAFDPGGASGTPWPGRPTVQFSNLAHDDDGTLGLAAYAIDSRLADPFGFADTEDAVRNHVVVTVAGVTEYDDDNPTSIQRHDRRTLQLSWLAQNDDVSAAILTHRANATKEAVPLHTTVDTHGFHPGPATGDFYDEVQIVHQTAPGRSVVTGEGLLRHYAELVAPRPGGVSWSITSTVDIRNVDVSDQLNPPEDLTLEDVTDTSAEFSWTNPSQTITPTHVQVRMLGHTDLWTEFVYPITTRTWHSLNPETGYTFQVRLLRRVDGLITHFSAAASLDFDTLEAELPVIDIDDDGDGTATLPDPDPGCTLEWKLESSDDGTTWTLVDDGTDSTPPYTVDLSGYTFDPTLLYKVCSREVCSGTPGAWSCSNLFAGACSDPPILGSAPFDDADLVAYWPGICPPDDIVEAISEEHATHGPNFDTFVIDGDGNIVLVGDGEGVIAYGVGPAVVDAITGDTTIACKVMVMSQPDDPVVLFGLAGLWIEAIAEGSNWSPRAKAHEDGAGITTITPGSLELDFGAWYDIAIVHDVAAGDLYLYVGDGDATTEEASALGTVTARHNSGIFQIGGPDNTHITNCAIWDRVLDITELPGYVEPSITNPLDIADCTHWWDASTLAGADGSAVSTIDNLAALGGVGDLQRRSATNSPNLQTAELNGLNVVALGTSNGFNTPGNVYLANGATVFIVCKVPTMSANGVIIAEGDPTDANCLNFIIHANSAGQWLSQIRDHALASPLTDTETTFELDLNAWQYLTYRDTGTAVDRRMNGVAEPGGAVSYTRNATPSAGHLDVFTIGYRQNGGTADRFLPTTSYMAECIIYDRPLTDDEIVLVEANLADKWGL